MSGNVTVLRRSGLFGLTVIAIILAVAVGVLLWQAVEWSSVSQVSARIEQLKPFATGVRIALIGLLALFWPALVRLAYRGGRLDEDRRDNLLAQHRQLIGWLVIIELVLGQDLPGRFFAFTTGAIV